MAPWTPPPLNPGKVARVSRQYTWKGLWLDRTRGIHKESRGHLWGATCCTMHCQLRNAKPVWQPNFTQAVEPCRHPHPSDQSGWSTPTDFPFLPHPTVYWPFCLGLVPLSKHSFQHIYFNTTPLRPPTFSLLQPCPLWCRPSLIASPPFLPFYHISWYPWAKFLASLTA